MKNRGTYLLLGLFFAGLIGLYAADFAQIPTRARRERMSTRILHELLDTKPDDLRKLEILGGEEPLVFERREGNRWQMTSPMDVAADPSKVETLAYNLKELTRKPDSATLEGDPSLFGLTPPDRTIKLWGASTDAPMASLEVGRASLDRRYVRAVGSEGVEVVDARGFDLLRLPAVRWRDHELFRVPSFEVDAVGLQGGGKDLKLRRGRDAWRVVEPIHVLAAEAKVDGLIADLGSLRVLDDTRFVANDVKDADLDRFGLKTPTLIIEVSSGRVDRRKSPEVIHVGKPVEGKEGQVYVRRADQNDIVIVDRRVLRDLKADPNSFRSPKVADINPARVVRIEVQETETGITEVVRTGNDWLMTKPSTARADRKAIQEFLKSLDQLQTSIYLSPGTLPDSGLETPSITLKVWQVRDPSGPSPPDPNGELVFNLRIGRRDVARKSIYAQVEGDSTILALPDSANDFLPRNPLAFRDRQVLSVATDRVEQIKLVGPNNKQATLHAPIFKSNTPGLAPFGWWMVDPVDSAADAPAVGRLLRLLGDLRADRLVTQKSDQLEKYGLATPALTLTWSALPSFSMVETPPKSGTIRWEDRSLLIGGPLVDRPNVRFAKLGDRPLIFTVGPEVLGVLDAEFHDHRVFSFDPSRVKTVLLSWPDRSLIFHPTDESGSRNWVADSTTEIPQFDSTPLPTLLQAASKLTTNRFLQYLGEFRDGTGLLLPFLTIQIELDDGSPPKTLKIGAMAARGQFFATSESANQGAVFLVPENLVSKLISPPRLRGDLPDNVFAP